MTIRAYLWGMRFCTLAALAALAFVTLYVDPGRDGAPGQVMFYASLFFTLTGVATLFLFWLRRRFLKSEAVDQYVAVSFRQGVLVALAVAALLALQSFRLLVWWDGGIIVAGVLLIELWFLSR